jgi:hypothetical protein
MDSGKEHNSFTSGNSSLFVEIIEDAISIPDPFIREKDTAHASLEVEYRAKQKEIERTEDQNPKFMAIIVDL